MKAGNFYTPPANTGNNKKINKKRILLRSTILMAGILFSFLPAMAQTYYNVSNTSGASTEGGIDVTVDSMAADGSHMCGGPASPYEIGNGFVPGNYTWIFSSPVTAVRIHIDALNVGSDVSVMINGDPYSIQSGNLRPYSPTCFGTYTGIASGGNLVANPDSASVADAEINIAPGFPITSFTLQSLGGGGPILSDFNFTTDTIPAFVNGTNQTDTICENTVSVDISSLLRVNDPSTIDTLTWSQFSAPAHGALSVAYSSPANGGNITPAGLTYSPTPGYSGTDAFTVQVIDNIGDTAYTTVNVTVNPTPDVMVSRSSQTVCNGLQTDSVTVSDSVAGATYTWSSSNTSIGAVLPVGTDSIVLPFTATNSTFAQVTDYITVTPLANGCPGMPQIFSITVNPSPDVADVSSQIKCNGTMTDSIGFTGDVDSTVYNWANSASIGLATTGSGDISSFSATNPGSATITDTVIVTPVAQTCVGVSDTFMITVNPTPIASAYNLPQSKCNGTLADSIGFMSSVSGANTFTWTNSDTTIGLAASGTGDSILSFPATDTTDTIVTATITVTPSANGCAGIAQPFTFTVNPTPRLNSGLTIDSTCGPVNYTPTSATEGLLSMSWIRDTVIGITPGSAVGTNSVSEILTNSNDTAITVTYAYTLSTNTCNNTQNVTVVVKPLPTLSSTLSPAAICDSAMFKYLDSSNTYGITGITWSRDTVAGNPAASGSDSVDEMLVNTTDTLASVVYIYTISAGGCSNTQNVTVNINTLPVLSSAAPAQICNNQLFTYVPQTSAKGIVTFAWSRALQAGISNPAASGGDTISETLTNTSANPIAVVYMDTLTINGCKNMQPILETVNPTPKLSSVHKAPAICSGGTFDYTPASATTGATYAWTRAYVPGIVMVAGSGTDNPNEQLIDSFNDNLTVVYVYSIGINGCYGMDSVSVVVHPTPMLSSVTKETICSGTPFTYIPESYTSAPQVTYSWVRAAVAGITPASGSGSGIITDSITTTGRLKETLINSATSPVTVQYVFILKVDSVCPNMQDVAVTVNPAPAVPVISIMPGDTLCSNTHYQNFGASTLPPAGTTYKWSAVNANVWATGSNTQNSLVSFNEPGKAWVIVASSMNTTGCANADTFAAFVETSSSDDPQVVYYQPAGEFLCLEGNMTSYQWGYDNKSTLDSTILPGEVNQVYFNNAPDNVNNAYWVMTTNNGCSQKSYYTVPTGVTNINTEVTSVKVYPNPANDNVNVEISGNTDGNMQVEILNLLGQRLNTTTATDNKATINVASLPAGCYLVNCYRDGDKIATAKFIKN